MLARVAASLSSWSMRWIPDPLVIAVALSLLTFALALMAVFSMGTALFHWGVSLIGSAVFARHLARRRPEVEYPLLIASAYLGMGAVWHAGLSGSVPLLVATPGHFLAESTGIIPI